MNITDQTRIHDFIMFLEFSKLSLALKGFIKGLFTFSLPKILVLL